MHGVVTCAACGSRSGLQGMGSSLRQPRSAAALCAGDGDATQCSWSSVWAGHRKYLSRQHQQQEAQLSASSRHGTPVTAAVQPKPAIVSSSCGTAGAARSSSVHSHDRLCGICSLSVATQAHLLPAAYQQQVAAAVVQAGSSAEAQLETVQVKDSLSSAAGSKLWSAQLWAMNQRSSWPAQRQAAARSRFYSRWQQQCHKGNLGYRSAPESSALSQTHHPAA
jgi:hypothetical protein